MLVEGVAEGYDEQYGLLRLRAAGTVMHVAHKVLAPGAILRLRILARDVSLTLAPVAGSSILNQLPATVVEQWAASDGANVIIKLDAGGTPLLARITRRSRDLLALESGTRVWAHVKASTLLPIL